MDCELGVVFPGDLCHRIISALLRFQAGTASMFEILGLHAVGVPKAVSTCSLNGSGKFARVSVAGSY